ncbi:MAG: hypothetical protein ACOH18_05485 [Candidatus Saccharimonadaceae bacterium]
MNDKESMDGVHGNDLHTQSRRFGATFKMFMECMKIAARGKTFLYVHPNFVAIDKRTWDIVQSKLHAPIISYNEAASITDKDLKAFEKQFKKFK